MYKSLYINLHTLRPSLYTQAFKSFSKTVSSSCVLLCCFPWLRRRLRIWQKGGPHVNPKREFRKWKHALEKHQRQETANDKWWKLTSESGPFFSAKGLAKCKWSRVLSLDWGRHTHVKETSEKHCPGSFLVCFKELTILTGKLQVLSFQLVGHYPPKVGWDREGHFRQVSNLVKPTHLPYEPGLLHDGVSSIKFKH